MPPLQPQTPKQQRRTKAQVEKERARERKLRGRAVSAPAGDISRRERKTERMGRDLKWEVGVEDDYGREKKEAAAFARGALGVWGEEWKKGDGKGKGERGDVTMNE